MTLHVPWYIKLPLWLVGGGIGIYVVLYLLASGDYPVPPTAAGDPAIPVVSVNGAQLHVLTYGDPGNPVVIGLHGGPGMDHQSIRSLHRLADEFFVVLYDQRGTGLSPRVPKSQLTLTTYMQDLAALIDQYGGGQPVDLVGHSFGGSLTGWFLGRYPEKVRRAVLAEPAFLSLDLLQTMTERMSIFSTRMMYHLARGWFQSRHVDGPDAEAPYDFLMAAMARAGDPGYFCDGAINPDLMPLARAGFDAWAGLQESVMQQLDNGTISEELRNFTRPVLFLASSCNTINGRDFQSRQLRFFPGAAMQVIEHSGHFMFDEQPDATMLAIRSFLKVPAEQ